MADTLTEAAGHGETAGHAAETLGACVNSHGGAIGMPQLCTDWIGNQIFWLVIALLVLFFILSRIALPRIAAVLAERAGTITNDLAAAEELKQRAAEAEEAYNKALADARAEAARIVADAKAEIQGDLDAATAKADAEIAAKAAESEKAISEIKAGALAAVETVARDAARDIVAALGAEAADDAVSKAVQTRLKG